MGKMVPDVVARDRQLLDLRRMGFSFPEIADRMGFRDEFQVIDALNALYKRMRPIDVNEIRGKINNQIDDLVTVYTTPAMSGDLKSAAFVLKALELQARLNGAIVPPSVNVQVNSEKPWERITGVIMVDSDESGVIDGQLVDQDQDSLSED